MTDKNIPRAKAIQRKDGWLFQGFSFKAHCNAMTPEFCSISDNANPAIFFNELTLAETLNDLTKFDKIEVRVIEVEFHV